MSLYPSDVKIALVALLMLAALRISMKSLHNAEDSQLRNSQTELVKTFVEEIKVQKESTATIKATLPKDFKQQVMEKIFIEQKF